MIPFNKPYLTGKELDYIKDAVSRGKISGNGYFTQKCHEFFQKRYGFKKCLLTTSCTDALEMAGIVKSFSTGDAAVRALEAGADVLLMPTDPEAVVKAVMAAVQSGRLTRQRKAVQCDPWLANSFGFATVAPLPWRLLPDQFPYNPLHQHVGQICE